MSLYEEDLTSPWMSLYEEDLTSPWMSLYEEDLTSPWMSVTPGLPKCPLMIMSAIELSLMVAMLSRLLDLIPSYKLALQKNGSEGVHNDVSMPVAPRTMHEV